MMYRLGLRLTLRSGREPFVRLVVTAAAVAVGVAIMLGVLADFHAFTTTNNRPAWESTQGQSVGRDYRAATGSELWNYGNDIYQGRTIERLDVAALGPRAPVPPGISRLPGAGQYYASPALANTANMIFSDNPRYSTQPIAGPSSPAASPDMSKLYLQAVLVKVNGAATLERVRTFLVTHTAQSASGTAPRTFGEAVQARAAVTDTIRRLLDIAVTLTLVVAGCSLAVSVGGSLTERKRPFTLLRVTGTPTSTLYRVVLAEAVLPLTAATVIAAGVGYVIAVLTVGTLAPAGRPMPVPGHTYFLTMGAGLIAAFLVILASLPLLRRITSPETVRFE